MGKFASGLLNYVESVNINGVYKTAFYSEFATNLVVGDKVYIINGNYDSDSFIARNNYSTGTDGYTILQIDKCRIVLDIDYDGTIPYVEDSIDNYIKVYHIKSQQDFDYINNITTNSYNNFYNKFEYGLSNNILYTDTAFIGSTNSIFGEYSAISSDGFYQRITSFSVVSNWQYLNGSPYGLLATSYFHTQTSGSPTYSLINNGKLLIIGEDIVIGETTLRQRGIYSFNTSLNKWTPDIVSYKPYISKLNFRNGSFNGIWNDGIFGSYVNNSNTWNGNSAIWNSGIVINSNWSNGIMKSKSDIQSSYFYNSNTALLQPNFSIKSDLIPTSLTLNSLTASRLISHNYPNSAVNNQQIQNYYAKLDSNGLPSQTTDYSNNNGHGFNYILDSNIEQINIYNGNFINCNIGLTNYGTNALDVYYGLTFSYLITSNNGYFKFCDINTSLLSNSIISDSNILNSNLPNNRFSSNQIKNSVVSGIYNSEDGITILNADLWSYNINGSLRGVLKLFISDSDLLKLQDFEVFYIKNINKDIYLSTFNDENKVWLNLENKYILDYFNNFDLSTDPIIVSRKNANENKYKTYINSTSYTNTWITNTNLSPSIDIDLGSSIYWYKNGLNNVYATNSILTTDNVNNLFANTELCTADFASGIATKLNWENGNNINDNSSKITINDTALGLSFSGTHSLVAKISTQVLNKYDTFNIGDYIWLNGIDYIDPYSLKTSFSGTFKVTGISATTSWRELQLNEITNNISGLTFGGTFSIQNFSPNYISVNKFKIENSKIESGLFKTTLILNSNINNSKFDNLDQNLNIANINTLRFINTLFKDDNNQLNSGYFYKSHILNTNWNNAISFNSIFNQTFSNGVFNNGYWLNGSFQNGYFINSDDSTTTTLSFDNSTGYYRSWRNGTFNLGQFYNSTWIEGTFNNGRLFNSNWFGGVWNNGILGLKNTPYSNTTMGYLSNLIVGATQTYFYGGIVESAIIGGNSNIYWYNGSFNDGEFTSFGATAKSTWYNGVFNGGKFDGYAKWKNGTFNNGKFLSIYGSTSSNISQYSTAIVNPGYGFVVGNTFSITGGNNNAYGIVDSVSTGSGLKVQINSVGNIMGSGFILRVTSVSASATYSIASYSIWNGGLGYTSSEWVSISNFYGTSNAIGYINVTSGGSVSNITFTDYGFGFSASATYSTTVFSGAKGPILDASVTSAGSGYIIGDAFTISNGTASGYVTSVGYLGNVTGITLSASGNNYTKVSSATTSLYNFSKNHITSYTILNKGTNYTIGTYPTIPNPSSSGVGFTISIVSLDTNVVIDNCAWENGTFNGGQFGTQLYITNSSWYNGIFNGGLFVGKFWGNGVFTNGQFYGSTTFSVYKNESNFVNSFASNYYGIWLDGFVLEQPYLADKSLNVSTQILRSSDTKKITKNVLFKNMLWLGGTFSHNSATLENAAWLNGTFQNGTFLNSAFNPFVDQTLAGLTNSNLFSFNFNKSCIWLNGTLNNSTFYISEWKYGTFNGGYMLGGIWRNGTWLYGTAENIYWENGLWRNGNWNGTNFDVNSIDTTSLLITDKKVKSVLYNIANISNNTNIHLMNVFTGSSPELLWNPFMNASGYGWTYSGTDWNWSNQFAYADDSSGVCKSTINYQNNYGLQKSGNYDTNLLYALNQYGSTSIFTDYANYTITITGLVANTICTNLANPEYINIHVGDKIFKEAVNIPGVGAGIGYGIYYSNFTITKSCTKDDIITYTTGYNNTKLGIGKSSANTTSSYIYIFSVEVNKTLIQYNKTLNNTQYNIYGSTNSISISGTLSLPSLVPQSDIKVSIMFGNGKFYSGIWEYGVWNNGYRQDDTLTLCDLYSGGSYIRVDNYTHRIQLQFLNTQTQSVFNIGDYVSAGNLIGYTKNGERQLLKDKFKVVFVDTVGPPFDNIVLEYITKTPLNYITKDSNNHLIYVTKNIWLSGAFLSGYFNGVWNYGIFKGYPYILEMKDSHLIDCIFDGGHFVSNIGTTTYSITNISYNTGLIQNFTFNDNSTLVIGSVSNTLTYKSWIDTNYSTQSYVNVNRASTTIKNLFNNITIFENINNLGGYPTYDVLDSNSYFLNSYINNGSSYRLGAKQTIYSNSIPDNGNFSTPFGNTTSYDNMSNFINNGFTYSINPTNSIIITSNINSDTAELLSLSSGSASIIYLNNTNVITTKNRYYQSSIQFNSSPTLGDIEFLNQKYSFDHSTTNTLNKTEYFYNAQGLNIKMSSSNGILLGKISNISFYELDMIPFFQYATESNIDQTIYYPYTALAPYIDYTNTNYNYIGNITLNVNPNSVGYTGSFYSPKIFSGLNYTEVSLPADTVSTGSISSS